MFLFLRGPYGPPIPNAKTAKKEIKMDQIELWYKAQQDLKELKAHEAKLRRAICEDMFDGQQGSFKVKISNAAYDIVATSRITTSLDMSVYEGLVNRLSEAELACIKYKPSLIAKNYKQLPPLSLLDEAIVTKPAMPTLKLTVKV